MVNICQTTQEGEKGQCQSVSVQKGSNWKVLLSKTREVSLGQDEEYLAISATKINKNANNNT